MNMDAFRPYLRKKQSILYETIPLASHKGFGLGKIPLVSSTNGSLIEEAR